MKKAFTNNTQIPQVYYDWGMNAYVLQPGETKVLDVSNGLGLKLGDLVDVDLSSVAAGAVLYRNASEKWVNLSKGAFGRVLTLGASSPGWEGVKRLGVGDNFVQIATDGQITLEGDARNKRHIRVCAPSWAKGASAPSEGFIGIVPTLDFDASLDDEASYILLVPWRMALASAVRAVVDWGYKGTQDNGTVCWKLDYIDLGEGSIIDGATTTISKVTAGNHVTGKSVRTVLAPDLTELVVHHNLGLRIRRDESEDTLAVDACLIDVHFEIIQDKLGEPI